MIQLIDQLLLLLSATTRFPPDETVREVLVVAQHRLMVLRHRCTLLNKPFVVAIVGLSNVGKSTLMNALLGDDVAPAGNYPCTAYPVEFAFGEQLTLTVHPLNDYTRPHWVCLDTAELLSRLRHVVDEKEQQLGEISRVEVTAPLPILKEGLVLADTPGFNAVQLDEHDGTHQQALEKYLRKRTSQVFWVVRAAFGVDHAEKGFFERFLGELCDDIVVTGSEVLDKATRQRWRKHVASHLRGHVIPRFHFVSGLDGVEARRSRDSSRLECSGILDLESRLRELAVTSARVGALQQGVLDLARQLGEWAKTHWLETARSGGHFWSPPEWAELTSRGTENPLFAEVVAALSVPGHKQ